MRSLPYVALAALLSACATGDRGDDCDPTVERCSAAPDTGRGGRADGGGGGGRDTGTAPDGSETARPCDERRCDEVLDGSLPDSDGDLLPDCVEGLSDDDDDGLPACADDDADGDGMLDTDEASDDADLDGIPDFLDPDSDDDTIPDVHEGPNDVDEDGTPNYLDSDSDGDGWPDGAEYGATPGSGLRPIDRDGDRTPDFLDLDSDGDGLADSTEFGCPTSTDRTVWDTDADGYNDLVEIAFGSNACDPADDISRIVDFYFELPYQDPEQSDLLEFSTNVQQGDIVFNMDTTGSMGGEIGTLQSSLTGIIIPELSSRLSDPGFGVSAFDDFPCGGFGSGGDLPFELLQRVTRGRGDAQSAVNRLSAGGGADTPESGIESLYQLATGAGRGECATVPPFDMMRGLTPDVADGAIGGAGFRLGSLPIIVHITDAPTHARGESYGYGATRDEAYAALSAIGAKVVGVVSESQGYADTLEMASRTSAVVPTCAWDAARPAGCVPGQCCTGRNGSGTSTDASGMCPLVYSVSDSGAGLDTSIVSGIDALIRFAPIDVTTGIRPDPERLAEGIDTTCFITGVEPDSYVLAEGACATTPIIRDFDANGTNDGFENVTPGTQVLFRVRARNECVRPLLVPQVFLAYIDVIGDGTAVLDTQVVTVLVPPTLKP